MNGIYNGMNIIITTRKIQNKRHKKKRINKKWAKRYGYTTYEVQDHDKIVVIDNKAYLTEKTYNELKKGAIKWTIK